MIAFGALAFVMPSENLALFGVLLTVFTFSLALMDSSTDGLAVDVTPPDEQQAVQATMLVGRFGAIIILALLFGAVAKGLGYSAAFLVTTVFLALPLLWVLRLREPAHRSAEQAFEWGALRTFFTASYGVTAVWINRPQDENEGGGGERPS